MAERVLSVIVFPGGFNLPLWAGISEAQQAEVVSVLRRASQIVHH